MHYFFEAILEHRLAGLEAIKKVSWLLDMIYTERSTYILTNTNKLLDKLLSQIACADNPAWRGHWKTDDWGRVLYYSYR